MKTRKLIELLKQKKLHIATMESCTGGELASQITNISGSSDVFKFGAVTYSNDFKTKFGVDEDVIEKHTVYSKETAFEMAKAIQSFAGADIGVGITGKIGGFDDKNPKCSSNNICFVCILIGTKKVFLVVDDLDKTRVQNKKIIVEKTINVLIENI